MLVRDREGVEGLGRGNGRFSARRAVRADAVEGYDDDDRTARVARIVSFVEKSERKIRTIREDSKHEEEGIWSKELLSLLLSLFR